LVMFLSFSSFVLLLQVILDQKHTQSDKGSWGEKLSILLLWKLCVSGLLPYSLVVFHSFNSFVLHLVVASFS
jgi:hypothetical protein